MDRGGNSMSKLAVGLLWAAVFLNGLAVCLSIATDMIDVLTYINAALGTVCLYLVLDPELR